MSKSAGSNSGYDNTDPIAAGASRMAAPLSFLRPTTPYGENYTPSYTRYLNAPGSSYVHPLHNLFADRRPTPAPIRSTLFPASKTIGM